MGITRGTEYSGEYIFRGVRDRIRSLQPELNPHLALFGCSDEVNSSADAVRASVFGGFGGIFMTRVIGSQIFFQQIQIACSRGHRSNVFEVNVHLGEMVENGHKRYGALVGRDGHKRATCGALSAVLESFMENPKQDTNISQSIEGEVFLDFLGTLKFRLREHAERIVKAEDPMLEITRTNLDVQIHELIRQSQKLMRSDDSLAPLFVYGTIAYNRTTQPDTKSLEHFYAVNGPAPSEVLDLLP